MKQLIVMSLVTIAAHAYGSELTLPESRSKMQMDEVKPFDNHVEGDLDQEITDPKLRTDSGSKSRFSMSSSTTYTGGSLSQPFGSARPDLRGLPENQTDSSLDEGVRVRYRTSKNTSYTAGVSISVKTPLQGNVEAAQNQLSVGDPVITRNHTFAAFGMQNSWNLTGSYATSRESLRVDQVASIATDYTIMKVLNNGLHVGLTGVTWYNFFSTSPGGNALTALPNGGNYPDNRTAWELMIYPTLEYYITPSLSLRTQFDYFSWRHLYGAANSSSMSRLKEYQSLGLGISVTRDIYLYPNVQFLPLDIRSEYTNIGISSTINVF